MWRQLRESPILFYGLLALVAILWYMVVFRPLRAREEGLLLQQERLQVDAGRLRRQEARLLRLKERIGKARSRLASFGPRQVAGGSPQEVSTHLQDMVLKMAARAGLNVLTYRVSGVRSWGPFKVAGVRLTANGSTPGVVQFLRSMEADPHLIRVRTINIAKIVGRNPVLRITVEAEALIIS